MFSLKERIKDILIHRRIVTLQEFEEALVQQKDTGDELSEILKEKYSVDSHELKEILSEELALPPLDMTRLKIDPKAVQMLPKNFAVKYKMIALMREKDRLTLALSDPLNIFVVDNIANFRDFQIIPIMSSAGSILKAIHTYHSEAAREKMNELLADMQKTDRADFSEQGKKVKPEDVIEDLTDDAPIIQLTDTIIRQAVDAKASDVFIEPMENTLRIRYRVDGVIREVDRMPKALLFPLVSRIKIIASLDISEHRLPQDGRFRIIDENKKEIDFRVSVLPSVYGEKTVLRILNKDAGMVAIDKLGFEQHSFKGITQAARQPHGMILACGPTGSGKTTTLYSILKYIDTPEKNIVTVEDPIEYELRGANQVNVRPSIGLTFASSLRSILRQDPDIIMIGEIRDSETLDIAVKAALTGHLVLSSLHTTTAAGSVIRMINMGIERFLICSSLNAIIAQRLLRAICPKCKEAYTAADALIQKYHLDLYFPGSQKIELYHGKGCKKCLQTGYRGRIGISEVLSLTPEVKEMILADRGEIDLKKQARREGMVTMREDAMMKAGHGLTSLEEVIRITTPDEE